MRTPAKLILSGEHSVLYGAPAIGGPLGIFLHSAWQPCAQGMSVQIRGQKRTISLAGKLDLYRERYSRFTNHDLAIADVLPEPEDLITLTLAFFAERYRIALPSFELQLETEFPVSSGLGSSSSLILNILKSLMAVTSVRILPEDLLFFAREIENFQHGVSSGLDLALVAASEPQIFMQGKAIGPVPAFSPSVTLIYSGKPSVSTGECVAEVRRLFSSSSIWKDFEACTTSIQKALIDKDNDALKEGVIQNQKLLAKIGVVPEKPQHFIADCMSQGIAAKICGAGAIAGDGAGMIWALALNDVDRERVRGIASRYGYTDSSYTFLQG